jgi:NDP-sugar pyrophosphorylase family protein
MIEVSDFVAAWNSSPFASEIGEPWDFTAEAEDVICRALRHVGDGFAVSGAVAVHNTAVVEQGAVIKPPCILSPGSFVATNAYLRGGVFLDRDCIVGPCCEIKSTFLFEKSKIAHLSFVGDSIVGTAVNIEAGAIIANYRNEMIDKRIRILREGSVIETGIDKFGALVGDGSRIGANAVIAPGALLDRDTIVPRLVLVDQCPSPQR